MLAFFAGRTELKIGINLSKFSSPQLVVSVHPAVSPDLVEAAYHSRCDVLLSGHMVQLELQAVHLERLTLESHIENCQLQGAGRLVGLLGRVQPYPRVRNA